MKKLTYILFVALCLSCVSCDDSMDINPNLFGSCSNNHQEYSESTPVEVEQQEPDTTKTNKDVEAVKENVDEVKSDLGGVKNIVDSLSIRLTSTEDELVNSNNTLSGVKKELEDLKLSQLSVKVLFIVLVVYTILIILLVLYLVPKLGLKKKDIKQSLTVHEREYHSQNVSHSQSGSAQSLKNSREIIDLRKQVEELERKVRRFEYAPNQPTFWDSANQSSSQVVTSQAATGLSQQVSSVNTKSEQPGTSTSSRQFYLGRPISDNTFDASTSKENPTEDSFYKFERDKKNPSKAKFEFSTISEMRTKFAINTQDSIIDPVCDAEISNTNNGECVTIIPGEAELKNGQWIVTHKAKVIIK